MGIPLIALQGQPLPQQDMVGEAVKGMQLRNLAGQNRLQQLNEQQIQMQMEDNRKISQARMENNDNPDATIAALTKAGLNNPNALIELKKNYLSQQEAVAKLDEKMLANHQAHVKALGDAAQSILALPDELQQAGYNKKATELISQGIAKPQEIPPFSKDNVRMLAAESMGMKNLLDTEAENKLKAAQLLKAQSEATIAQQESKLTPQERAGLKNPGQAEMADWLAKNPGKGPSDFLVWKAKNSPTFLQQAIPTAANDPMVDMVGQNRIDYATAVQRMTPAAKAQFTKDLSAKYPNFNQSEFGVEKAVSKAFTSGAEAKNLTAFNTAIEHAKQLHTAAEALNVGDMRTMNKIGNALGYEFGSDKTTNFNVIKNALSGEISKVFKGGQATDAEIKAVQEPFDAANSPAQLKGAIRNAISLMNSKRDALKKQYEAGKQAKPNFGEEIGGTIRARDTNGQLHEAPAGTKLPPGWKLEQ